MGLLADHGTSARPSRLLMLHEDTSLIEAVSRALQPTIPRLAIETCGSLEGAQELLTTSPCQVIVSSPLLTVTGGVSVLTCSRRVRPAVPFLLAVGPEEREVAHCWLDLGVYDFIFSPLEPSQVLESVQQALILSKWRAMIAHKEEKLTYLRQRRERYQNNTSEGPLRHQVNRLLQGSILQLEISAQTLQYTATRIEASLKRLERSCRQNELHAQQRALSGLRADLAG
jgi:DNA-binding NtrC family response regulator